MVSFRETATKEMKDRYQGMMQTVWSGPEAFLDEYYGRKKPVKDTLETSTRCFKVLFDDINKL
jgi:hypothetical protein